MEKDKILFENTNPESVEGKTEVGVIDVNEALKNADQGEIKDDMGECKYNISAPLFLMFAEYLGYVGKTLSWVDEWCVDKKKPEPYKIKFIEIEAYSVLKEAKKKFTIEKLRELYDELYEVILYIYDDNLKEMEKPLVANI